jgi:hypothetical protein
MKFTGGIFYSFSIIVLYLYNNNIYIYNSNIYIITIYIYITYNIAITSGYVICMHVSVPGPGCTSALVMTRSSWNSQWNWGTMGVGVWGHHGDVLVGNTLW